MKNWRTLVLGLLLNVNIAFAAPQEIDKVIAVVNNAVVLQSDIDELSQSVKLNAQRAQQPLPDDTTLHQQVLERLIMDTILLQMAQKMGITVTQTQLDEAIADIAEKNQISVAQMRRHLTDDGINYDSYRAQIRKDMLIAQVRNHEVRRRITVSVQEVESLSKQIAAQNNADSELNLSHILLPLPNEPSQQQLEDSENLAKKLIAEIKKGTDFGKLAMAYSADSQALEGGGMGWNRLQELPALFAERLKSAHQGEIIGPIRSGVGFHIFAVNAVRGPDKKVSVTEVHARHILLKPSVVMTDDQAREKLHQIAQKIQQGQGNLTTFARQISQDPGSAEQGGDLGWSSPDNYDPVFRDALLTLRKGEISGPVRSTFGWHLIQLIDTRQVDHTDAVQKNKVYRMLFSRKFTQEAQIWMQEQRAAAWVKILDDQYARQ